MNVLMICILITITVFFIIKQIDKKLYYSYMIEKNKVKYLTETLRHIQSQLRLTQLKECPKSELKQIPKDMIDWIDELKDMKLIK